jgi:hypothetical protein
MELRSVKEAGSHLDGGCLGASLPLFALQGPVVKGNGGYRGLIPKRAADSRPGCSGPGDRISLLGRPGIKDFGRREREGKKTKASHFCASSPTCPSVAVSGVSLVPIYLFRVSHINHGRIAATFSSDHLPQLVTPGQLFPQACFDRFARPGPQPAAPAALVCRGLRQALSH